MYLTGRGTFFLMFCRCVSRFWDVLMSSRFLNFDSYSLDLPLNGIGGRIQHWRCGHTGLNIHHRLNCKRSTGQHTGFNPHTPQMDTDLDDWIFTISVTWYKFDRWLQDDLRRIASDVSSSRPTSSGSTNIVADDQHSARGPTRLFKQPGVPRTNTLIYTCWVLYTISLYFLMVIVISEWQDSGPLRARDTLWS